MIPLLLFIVSAAAADNCSYLYGGVRLGKHEVLKVDGLPTNLVYNHVTDELHFTLIDLDTLHDDHVQTKMEQYMLKGGEMVKVPVNGQAATLDAKNGRVYIATDKGIYEKDGNQTKLLAMENQDVVQIFKPNSETNQDEIYAVLFPDSEVFAINLSTLKKRRIENVPCAFILAVDSDENIFYECDSKYVKMLLKGFQEPIEFVGIPKNSARALAVDDDNIVVLAANDGLYWLSPNSIIPKKVMELDFVPSGISVGGARLFLSTSGSIYKFTYDC